MKRIPLYIDTDMGVDDIIALCMIVASNRYTLRGISVVNGVCNLQCGIYNLNRILRNLDVSCPIYRGANQIEQKSGVQFPTLDRFRANTLALLPKNSLPKKGISSVFPLLDMKNAIQNEPMPVTFFSIGPLTNVAYLVKSKCVADQIKNMVIMGGTLSALGIVPPKFQTEYNIRLDAQAADKVFQTNIPKILVSLDATQYVRTKIEDTKGKQKQQLVRFYNTLKSQKSKTESGRIMRSIILHNQRDFSQFYDPLAAAICIDPSIATRTIMGEFRAISSGKNIGVVKIQQKKSIMSYATSIDTTRFYTLMLKLMQ